MARTVGIGIQDFETIITNDYFYIDKTTFIKEWWESGDSVTLITRPRRFGKTLTMSMVEKFFSIKYNDKKHLFTKLNICREEKYVNLQGTYPVISLSFASIKEKNFELTREKICRIIVDTYKECSFLKESTVLTKRDKDDFDRVTIDMGDTEATMALYHLSELLNRHYGKKVIILLDEYDTPMQEAYVNGYWDELIQFIRSLFNITFKTNPWLERGLMTGITRVSKESVFSDLNNLEVVTTTSDKYATAFGFTKQEVRDALDEMGYAEFEIVKQWYDGFRFGNCSEIYNPWSILNYLDKGKFSTYWVNTSSNNMIGKLVREASEEIKIAFEDLLAGKSIKTNLDEQIVYEQLNHSETALWSLMLASGYLKVIKAETYSDVDYLAGEKPQYELVLTNMEVQTMFRTMIEEWFTMTKSDYNRFVKALLMGDIDAMNSYMNRVALNCFSFFDTGNRPAGMQPERFYHGFVLGLLVELEDKYVLTSNRESGFGRYDVMLKPKKIGHPAIIIEFKVVNPNKENSLKQAVDEALRQIEEKQYETVLIEEGISEEMIQKYGFAFEGKKVLIGK